MLIAVPSDTTDGLDARISDHFGHCAAFTLIDVKGDAVTEVSVLENSEHVEGGCMAPVNLLKERGVEVLLAGGMGGRPLAGFQRVGIEVRSREGAGTVREAIELFVAGGCRVFGEAQTCGGEGGCGGHHHHHHEPEVVPIDGRADIRDGRMVTVEYELKDTDGAVLDVAVGSMVTAQDAQGRQFPLVVVHLDDDVARLDANHPLAGKDLVFDLTVKMVEAVKTAEG